MSELLEMISDGLKNPIKEEDLTSEEIKISHLKRIDKIFDKGLHYYLDPKSPEITKSASIFFRKATFNTELNLGARKIVNQFEDLKISLSAIAKLVDLEIERQIPVYKSSNSPKEVANRVREILYPKYFEPKLRDFLKSLITTLAQQNVLVFEFVETWNKKDKANIDGIFLSPNVIVLKRQQEFFRREIFTLAHELGHYLLNKEEVERVDYIIASRKRSSEIERWCNDFAYYFLAGQYSTVIEKLSYANSSNDYHLDLISKISRNTHLSKLSLFTKLLYDKKLSNNNYQNIKQDFAEQYKRKKEAEEKLRELKKASGEKITGRAPNPINSPLFVSTIQTAFYEGILNEYEVCKRLNITPEKFDAIIE
jgi:Zn-dependent peptidase ImmA (M78 family)